MSTITVPRHHECRRTLYGLEANLSRYHHDVLRYTIRSGFTFHLRVYYGVLRFLTVNLRTITTSHDFIRFKGTRVYRGPDNCSVTTTRYDCFEHVQNNRGLSRFMPIIHGSSRVMATPSRTCYGYITVYHDFSNRGRSGRKIGTV